MFKVLAIICILVFSPRSFACSVVGGLPKLDWMYENSNFVFFGKVCSRDNNFWKTALSLVEKLKCAQLLCCIALIFLMSIDDIYPMKIRHDVDDQNYLNLGEKYSQSVAYLGANRCASTLIDRYWILTAAHCVKGAERAILSVLHTDRRYRVGSITIHPEYKKSKHDIALIQLTEPILAGWRTSNLELVRQLVKAGADVNISNINGDTPLIDAAYLGKNEILSFLLESGANINLKNKAGHSALGQKQPDYTDLDY